MSAAELLHLKQELKRSGNLFCCFGAYGVTSVPLSDNRCLYRSGKVRQVLYLRSLYFGSWHWNGLPLFLWPFAACTCRSLSLADLGLGGRSLASRGFPTSCTCRQSGNKAFSCMILLTPFPTSILRSNLEARSLMDPLFNRVAKLGKQITKTMCLG